MQTTSPQDPPRRRVWLYAPYVALAVLAVAWSAGWFVIRQRVVSGLDDWLAAEAAAGRAWTCPERSVAGYPFRIEVSCASLSFARPDTQASLGRLIVVAQVYEPGHVIANVSGPLRVSAGATVIDAQWRSLQASVHSIDGRPRRGDLVAETTSATIAGAGFAPATVTAERLESHLRPNPADETAVDMSLQLVQALVPGLDGLIGGTEPADLDLLVAVARARDLPARPLVSELERWRAAEGRLDVTRFSIAKGPRRIQAKGTLTIDEAHRPAGQFDIATARIEGFLGRFVGGKAGGAAGLLGALFGAPPAALQQGEGSAAGSGPPLTPLPPVRIANGRVLLGPIQIPGLRIDPLY